MAAHFPALVGLAAGSRVLVAGGTGTVGSGTALSLLKQGCKVLVSTRSVEKFDNLLHSTPPEHRRNLSVVWADVSTEKGVKQVLRQASSQKGGVQHVVASMGAWWQKGLLIEQTTREFNRCLIQPVTAHFLLLRAFIPYLGKIDGSSYVIVTGAAGHEYLAPHTSLLCVGAGALNGLALAARNESKQYRVPVTEVHITAQVHPLADADLPSVDPYTMGNDLMGAAITACLGMSGTSAMSSKHRGKIVIRHKNDAKDLIGIESRAREGGEIEIQRVNKTTESLGKSETLSKLTKSPNPKIES